VIENDYIAKKKASRLELYPKCLPECRKRSQVFTPSTDIKLKYRYGWHNWGQTKLSQSDPASLVATIEKDCSAPSLETVGTF